MTHLETIDLATVHAAVFRPHVDTAFTLRGEAGEFQAALIDVSEFTDHRPENEQGPRKPFGLVFKTDSAPLPQGIYALNHPVLPSCELFLSPFDGGADWCKLEAIFN